MGQPSHGQLAGITAMGVDHAPRRGSIRDSIVNMSQSRGPVPG
jgi:hypothetical protein